MNLFTFLSLLISQMKCKMTLQNIWISNSRDSYTSSWLRMQKLISNHHPSRLEVLQVIRPWQTAQSGVRRGRSRKSLKILEYLEKSSKKNPRPLGRTTFSLFHDPWLFTKNSSRRNILFSWRSDLVRNILIPSRNDLTTNILISSRNDLTTNILTSSRNDLTTNILTSSRNYSSTNILFSWRNFSRRNDFKFKWFQMISSSNDSKYWKNFAQLKWFQIFREEASSRRSIFANKHLSGKTFSVRNTVFIYFYLKCFK